MKPHIAIDSPSFQRTLAEYAKHSKRDMATLVNQKSYSILIKTAAQNRVADKGKIIAELGQQSTAIRAQKIRVTKGGIRRGKMVTERIFSPALYAIVRRKAAKAGRSIPASEMESAARKELARRLSSISFMKSGWLKAISNIAASIGKQRKARKGFGGSTPAKPGASVAAEFWNTSFDKPSNTTDKQPTRWALDALRSGFLAEMQNMRQRIAAKLARRG